jgi:hypothetical protein
MGVPVLPRLCLSCLDISKPETRLHSEEPGILTASATSRSQISLNTFLILSFFERGLNSDRIPEAAELSYPYQKAL